MTNEEKILTAELLKYAADEFSNRGYNDFPLKNTYEMRQLASEVYGEDWSIGQDRLVFYVEDHLLMSKLASKLLDEVKENL